MWSIAGIHDQVRIPFSFQAIKFLFPYKLRSLHVVHCRPRWPGAHSLAHTFILLSCWLVAELCTCMRPSGMRLCSIAIAWVLRLRMVALLSGTEAGGVYALHAAICGCMRRLHAAQRQQHVS